MKRKFYVAVVGNVPVASGRNPKATSKKAVNLLGQIYALGVCDVEEFDGIAVDVFPCGEEDYRRLLGRRADDVVIDMAAAQIAWEADRRPAGSSVH